MNLKACIHDIFQLQRYYNLRSRAEAANEAVSETTALFLDEMASFAKKYDCPDATAFSIAMQDDGAIASFIGDFIYRKNPELRSKEGSVVQKIRGKLNFTATELDITDPCYEKGVWCRLTVPITPGTYNYEVRISWEGEWGKRVKAIRITKEEAGFSKITYGKKVTGTSEDNPNGEVGVDSGRAGFFENKPNYTDEEFDTIHDHIFANWADGEFERVVEGHKNNIMKCECIETEAGYGDGGYFVKELLDKNKQWCGYELRFI